MGSDATPGDQGATGLGSSVGVADTGGSRPNPSVGLGDAPPQGMVLLKVRAAEPEWYVGPKPKVTAVEDVKNTETPEARLKRSRQKIFVPKGTTNLAFGCRVSSSDELPVIGFLNQLTDGKKHSRQHGYEKDLIELNPDRQWVQIDLGQHCAVYAVAVWHWHHEAGSPGRVYKDVVIRVGADKNMTKGVTTVFNNDHDNSSGFGIGSNLSYVEDAHGRVISTKGVKGRFVRLYSDGNNMNAMNHYYEVEVYGTPASAANGDRQDVK
jgi:hypothetical protein